MSLTTKGNPDIPAARTFHVSGILEDKDSDSARMLIVAGRNMIRRLNDTSYIDLNPLTGEPGESSGETPSGRLKKPTATPPQDSVTANAVMQMEESQLGIAEFLNAGNSKCDLCLHV